MVKVADSKADVVTLDDPRYPQRLKEIYDPPNSLIFTGDCWLARGIRHLAVLGWRSDWLVICRTRG